MITNNVDVHKFYKSYSSEFLGFIPVLDPNYSCCSYYSVENIHPNAEYERVVPCFEFNNEEIFEVEEFFFKETETLSKKIREDLKLEHEIYRDEYIENFKKKYVVLFVGCDDGDKVMRFESKQHALDFLSNIYFDEIIDDRMLFTR